MINGKYKVLVISDHALSVSGVGTQTRHLIEGLLKKNTWSFRQLGGAIKHENYNVVMVNQDFIIKPIDGFGNRDVLRQILVQEKPDVVFIFTDPRFFTWLFEMEDEVHQFCPIVWWHVWDNLPVPVFNYPLYEATDLINCHSYLTYEMVKEKFADKTNFVPHSLPSQIFFPIDESDIVRHRANILGSNRVEHFVALWVNRNAKRKRPNDVLWAWKLFLDKMKESDPGKNDVTLIMHTDPKDSEGPDLYATTEMFGIEESVLFSSDRLEFEKMNILHNISDCFVNISHAEGFGLGTLEAMQVGRPIIAVKTGGLTRQVVDHRDGTENGIALPVEVQTMVGSQAVPYIYDDYVSSQTTADAFYKMYKMGKEGRRQLGQKARDYVMSEFSYQKTIDSWHDTMLKVVKDWKAKSNWTCEEL